MLRRPITSGSRQAPDPYDQYLESRCMYRKHTARDASSLFRVIAEQMYDTQMLHYEVRLECVRFMTQKRRIFEHHVRGDFDSYMLDMAKPKTYGTMLELRAMCCMYRRNVVLFEPFNLGTAVTFNRRYRHYFRVFYTNENHFDSVYTLEYIETGAICQAICFKLLYKMIFKLPDISYAIETMLHPQTFDWGACDAEFDTQGYLVRLFCYDGRTFRMDLPEHTRCILENYRLCSFHNNKYLRAGIVYDKLQMGRSEDNDVMQMCPNPLISCVRQLLEDGITPFPYKVAKSLDPYMYRNIEFDCWNDVRKEAKRFNFYSGDYNFKVPYDSLHPLPPDQFRPWGAPYRYQRHIQKIQMSKFVQKSKLNKWKKAKLFNLGGYFDGSNCDQYLEVPNYTAHASMNGFINPLFVPGQQRDPGAAPTAAESSHQRQPNDASIANETPEQQQQQQQRYQRYNHAAAATMARAPAPLASYMPMRGRATQPAASAPWPIPPLGVADELRNVYAQPPPARFGNGAGNGVFVPYGYAPAAMHLPSAPPPPPSPYVPVLAPPTPLPAYGGVVLTSPRPTASSNTSYSSAPANEDEELPVHKMHNLSLSKAEPQERDLGVKPRPSLRANGEDLPADVGILRYFYNIGVDMHMRMSQAEPTKAPRIFGSSGPAADPSPLYNNTDQQRATNAVDEAAAMVVAATPPPSPQALATSSTAPSPVNGQQQAAAAKERDVMRLKTTRIGKGRDNNNNNAHKNKLCIEINKENVLHLLPTPTPTPSPNNNNSNNNNNNGGTQFNFYTTTQAPPPPIYLTQKSAPMQHAYNWALAPPPPPGGAPNMVAAVPPPFELHNNHCIAPAEPTSSNYATRH